METKPFYSSKTFWVNILACVALVVQSQTGFVVSLEEQTAGLAIINLVLRAVTSTGLSLK